MSVFQLSRRRTNEDHDEDPKHSAVNSPKRPPLSSTSSTNTNSNGRNDIFRSTKGNNRTTDDDDDNDYDDHEFDHHNPESPTWNFSELLIGLGSNRDRDEYHIVSQGNDLILLLKTYPNLKNDVLLKNLINKIQFMFYHKVSEIRSIGYKILRYVITNFESLLTLVQSKILIFIIVTLSTTRSSIIEKEQALKLIREFLAIERGSELLSIGVIKALIGIIECNNEHLNQLTNPDKNEVNFMANDNNNANNNNNNGPGISLETNDYYQSPQFIPDGFKNVCIETICEITLLNPELVFHSGGFKIILHTIIEGNFEMSTACLIILFKTLDYKNNRKFLRNGFDLNSMISIFSNELAGEAPVNSGNNANLASAIKQKKLNNSKLQKISFLITLLLKNFNGLMAFSINDFEALHDLIINLRKKDSKVRGYILDILFDVLRIKSLPWLASTSIGENIKRFNSYINPITNESKETSFQYQELNKSVNEFEYNLINHYRGLLTLILIKTNIFQYLIEIIEQNLDANNSSKAAILLTNIYAMANNLLPSELINKDLMLPKFSSLSSSFEFEKYTRIKFQPSTKYNQGLKSYIKSINLKSRYNIDDSEFKTLINNTKVLNIKEFEEWNWKILSNLMQGPLLNPKRFDEILEKNPKFLKRLISFYRPFKFRFCNIPIGGKQSSIYINVGVQLFELLLSLDSGIKYLSSSKILPQLSEIFAQIDPYSGIESKDPILSKTRLETTCSLGYLKFIGMLSSKPIGVKLLEQWQFFNLILNIIETSSHSEQNNNLIVTLFKYIDFSKDNQFRILLLQSFKVSNFKIKHYYLSHLIPNLLKIKECHLFVLKLLVNNLYDDNEIYEENESIIFESINLLNNYFNDLENLDNLNYFIRLRPSILILNSYVSGKRLLSNCLKTSSGFRYLEEFGFIDNEFLKWIKMDDFKYLYKIEMLIYGNLFPYVSITTQDDDYYSINFFKYLLSTEEGLNYFTSFNHKNFINQLIQETEFIAHKLIDDDEFVDNFENNFNDKQDQDKNLVLLNTLKQNLWIIGNIASGTFGIQLLLNNAMYTGEIDTSIITTILNLFKFCPIWQIRSISFYVLGMISSTEEGIEILDELNWITVFDQYSQSKSLCYPKDDILSVFNIEISNPYRTNAYYAINNSTFAGINANDLWISSRNGSVSVDVLLNENAIASSVNGNGSVTGNALATSSVNNNDDNNNEPGSPNASRENIILFDTNEIINNRIIYLLQRLNAVIGKLERKATKELIKLKRTSPEIFDNLQLFLEVIKLIDKDIYKFEKRKFIFDLFLDTKVLETLLKRERKNSMKV
ncbi:Rapamycin-insensitive companion of mTOR, middle domain-containing protein [Scheffersomyces coipomensis]|uniref:Rapamycin-insensitive companion of mTOR, middle domain-containing protein n=1 Tax=Scheffersomyces coipomensis TaxID=1788519 RepID=UPI00315D4F24